MAKKEESKAIQVKPEGWGQKKVYYFYDPDKKKSGTARYKEKPENIIAKSVEEAEFLVAFAKAENKAKFIVTSTYEDKESVISKLEDGKTYLKQAKEYEDYVNRKNKEYEDDIKRKKSVTEIVNLAKDGESKDFTQEKISKMIPSDLIELPDVISADSRVQDSKGFKFLMDILKKSEDAIVRRYSAALYQVSEKDKEATLILFNQNTNLFTSQVKQCVFELLANKAKTLKDKIDELNLDTKEKQNQINALNDLTEEYTKKAKEMAQNIANLKKTINKSNNQDSETLAENINTIVTNQTTLNEAQKSNDDVTKNFDESKIKNKAVMEIFNNLSKTQSQNLLRALSSNGIELDNKQIQEILNNNKLPDKLVTEEMTDEEKLEICESIISKINEEISKIKKEESDYSGPAKE